MTDTLAVNNDASTQVATMIVEDIGANVMPVTKIHTGANQVDGGPVTAANPLPVSQADAATATLQTAGNASLTSLDGKVPALGQALAAASVPVVLTAAQLSTLTPTAGLTDAELRATAVPVSGPLTDTQIRATALPVSAASLPLPSGAASAANQATEIASLASIDTKITAVNTGAVVVSSSALPSGASTAAKQPALGTAGTPSADVLSVQGASGMTPLKTDGSGVTQPVSGPLTDTQLRATAVPVSGPVTDTQLRASAVPVSLASVPSHAVTNGGTFATQATVQAGASGGWTPSKLVSAATTNATSLKASAGQIGYIFAGNVNAAARYLKLYDKASAPTVGTDTPVHTFMIPGNTAGSGFALNIPAGIVFSTGIAFALTTGAGDSDTGAVAASEITVNIGYK